MKECDRFILGEGIGAYAAWRIRCTGDAIAVDTIATFVKLVPAKVDDMCIEFRFAEAGVKPRVVMR